MGKNRRISPTLLHRYALRSPLICEAWRGRIRQTPKWEKAPLQKFCKHQNEEKRPCRSPANAKIEKSTFAETLQSPETSSKCLRESRKSPGKLFGVCGSPASLSRNFLAFAGVPQVPRKTFWCLRESRKSLEKLFDVCGSPASLSRNFLAFAGVPQVSRKTFWCLRDSRKHLHLFSMRNGNALLAPFMQKSRRWHLCRHFRTASNPC